MTPEHPGPRYAGAVRKHGAVSNSPVGSLGRQMNDERRMNKYKSTNPSSSSQIFTLCPGHDNSQVEGRRKVDEERPCEREGDATEKSRGKEASASDTFARVTKATDARGGERTKSALPMSAPSRQEKC